MLQAILLLAPFKGPLCVLDPVEYHITALNQLEDQLYICDAHIHYLAPHQHFDQQLLSRDRFLSFGAIEGPFTLPIGWHCRRTSELLLVLPNDSIELVLHAHLGHEDLKGVYGFVVDPSEFSTALRRQGRVFNLLELLFEYSDDIF